MPTKDARFTFRRDGTVEYGGEVIGRIVAGKERPWGTRTYKPCYDAFDIHYQCVVNTSLRPAFWTRQAAGEALLAVHQKRSASASPAGEKGQP